MEVRYAGLLALAAGWMVLCAASTAHAQWSPDADAPGAAAPQEAAPPLQWKPQDWGWSAPTPEDPGVVAERNAEGQRTRVKTAAAVTGVSGGVMLAGLVTYLVGQGGSEACGLTGCFTHPNEQLEVASLALLGAGGGMALVAVPTLLDALFVERAAPREAGRMGWGMALTAVGVGSAASVGMMAYSLHRLDQQPNNFSTNELPNEADEGAITVMMIAQGLSAAAHLGVGIPLWAKGGRGRPDDSKGWTGDLEIVPNGTGLGVKGSF